MALPADPIDPAAPAVPGGESGRHRWLKARALGWARENGFAIAAAEVRVPRSGFRADVAAIGRGPAGRTAILECKQSRADLLKDAADAAAVRGELDALVARRAELEAMLAVHRPDLRRGDTLFPEFDAWDFPALEHKTYRGVLARIATLQGRLLKGTKFGRMLRYRCADFLYLVVEDDLLAEAEIPAGWGLLVRRAEDLVLRRRPAALEPEERQRRDLLESIALAASLRAAPPPPSSPA